MNTDRRKENEDKVMDELLQDAFGLSDAQILEQLRLAEETVDDSEIPLSPENWEKQLAARLDSERKKKEKERRDEESRNRKVHWLRMPFRILIAAAVAMTVLLSAGVTAVGKRNYEYRQSERVDVRNNVALDNEDNFQEEGKLEDTYEKIGRETGLHVLTMGYRPTGMILESVAIEEMYAEMQFEYKGRNIFFVQEYMVTNSSSNIVSDRKNLKSIYNSWLGQDIMIQSSEIESGIEEYSVEVHIDKTYYYLTGIMELDEFEKIVKELHFN